jgi:hypothetical protein
MRSHEWRFPHIAARIEFAKVEACASIKNQMTENHESWYSLPIGNA